ncbi:hypothetical protein ETAA8_07950 [Anatilimnocola aggregata]|uniref:Uncharacterized protein n=1 Tax=Anatilimnocola aggregata TaxID=2528021 RepID=A0A517Y669_9BACT|nr:hypothetical protein [Anatilimnocola aggregata]QDU25725.1 hypothetical protein ETAA8_07950 [Anatilimnocola aggregata]
MFDSLKTFLFGYEPKPSDLPPQAQRYAAPAPATAMDLARRGWRPHRLGNSQLVIFLPAQIHIWAGPNGMLYGGEDPPNITLTATLQQGFAADPSLAIDFVEDLAERRGLPFHHVGTYCCFHDPGPADPWIVADRQFLIGLPGSVVTLSLRGTRDAAATIALNEVRGAIPQLVGEMT